MSFPLEGVTVLDFSHALAGPYCTMLMAQYGATIVKVEGVASGDIGRTWGPPFVGPESSFFLGLNPGKQAVAIDLKDPRGVDLCLGLARHADVLIENFRPGTMERLGLGFPAVAAANPRLVYCSISGYGQTGPRRDDPAMDLILQASSGLISVTGSPSGEVARCGHSVADITAGMFALIGILLALKAREQTGRGQLVDVSMLDAMISAMSSNYANFFGSGVVPRPWGTAFGWIVPYACFPTKDREIAIAVASDKLWRSFCQAVGREDWVDDPRFATNAVRVKNRAELEPAIVEVLRQRSAAEWAEVFREHGVPHTPVQNLADVAADPHAAAREMFQTLSHPTAGTVTVTGPPLKLSESEARVGPAAPLAARDTRAVLRDLLGRSEAEIAQLASEGVIAV